MNKRFTVQKMSICALFVALIAIGARLQITIPTPLTEMHFTLQWLFVLLAGFLLGGHMGTISVGVYLLIGLLGVPVFASGGGPAYLMKPTFGFLLGFLIAVIAIGYLSQIGKPSFIKYTIIAIIGLFLYYGTGMIYYYFISNYLLEITVGWQYVYTFTFTITIIPDFALCLLSVLATLRIKPAIQKYVK